MLQLRLLGQFDIRLNGKRILIPSRAGQSLLAYLTLTAGTPHRREVLAGILWPDFSEENARKNLRHELWRIRKALAGPDQVTDYLLADEFTIAFNRNADYWLDATQLERPDLDIQTLSSNLSLYQGELLPGFFEDWIVLERERIQTLFETKMEQLLNQLVAAERWIAVQEQGERWLSFGNSPEPAYRALMLAHGARGDMAKVSSIYQRCMNDLDEKFGLEPSAETRALYDGLLKGTQTSVHSAIIQQAGTITFLFTDIEESTRLLDKLGDLYAHVLADHHRIMRAAIQKWNGREVDTQGDAFFVAFTRALDAIQCAAEAQINLSSHPWTHGRPLRVRMGLHTGEPLIASTGYVGMDVHRAARIGDAAHGGQVLLSHTTRELVINDIPKGLSIRDLGEYRLKDLKFPTPVHQLVIDGLAFDFPPLRTKFSDTEAPTPGEPPFKGLQYFDEIDADLFFGREVLTAKLIRRLCESQFLLVIIGASGSGKSSLVRAGIIPALKKGTALIDGSNPPEDSTNWRIHILTPTTHPLEALATELTQESESVTATATLMDDLMQDPRSLGLYLARQKTRRHTLLVLDQFEELFTLCRDEFEREAFIDNLLMAVNMPAGDLRNQRITVILTLRADFYAHLAQYPDLRDAVAHQQEYIGPMTTEELRRAIEEPAKRAHWTFEPGLVDLILRDVGGEPGALPLLSHALLETWKRRAGHVLTLKGYADAGGVRGAISHTAESVYQNLSGTEQSIARNIFLRLTELGEGTEDMRRRASFDELISGKDSADEVSRVLNKLAEARLITLGENTAEVAHEALIREWHMLREWLDQDREGLRLHRNITEGAQEWELLEHDPGMLYRSARLSQAREWAALHLNALNAAEKAFLQASDDLEKQEQAEREAQQQRELEAALKLAETERQAANRLRLRNRIITVVGVIAVILAALTFSFSRQSDLNAKNAERNAQSALSAQAEAETNAEAANRARAEAEAQRRLAIARELAASADSTLAVDPELSILLALQGVDATAPDGLTIPEVKIALHRAIATSRIQKTVPAHEGTIWAMAYSPDGTQLATGGDDATVRIWNTKSYENSVTINAHDAAVDSIAFSPDGRRIVTSSDDGTAKVWNTQTGQLLFPLVGHSDAVLGAKFSPDGTQLSTLSIDNTIRFWNAENGTLLQSWENLDISNFPFTFSSDGSQVIYLSSEQLHIRDIQSRSDTITINSDSGIYLFALSPDGSRVAVIDDFIRVFDIASNQVLYNIAPPANQVEYMAFSPDGSRLAIAGRDTKVTVMDASSGVTLFQLAGHDQFVFRFAFGPDGKHLTSADSLGRIKFWSLEPAHEVLTIPNGISNRMALSPDGARIAGNGTFDPDTGASNLIQVWNVNNGNLIFSQPGHETDGMAIAFDPSGAEFVTSGYDQVLRVWDSTSGKELLKIPVADDVIYAVRYSPDGKIIAAVGSSGNMELFERATGKLIQEWETGLVNLSDVAFNKDASQVAVTSYRSTDIKVFDTNTGKDLLTLQGHTASNTGLHFSPDGTRIATSGRDGTARIWDAATGDLLSTLLGHTSTVTSVRFSIDNKLIVTSSRDGTIRVWDADTGSELNRLGIEGGAFNAEFTPDGNHIITGDYDGIKVFTLSIDELIHIASSRLTRPWTLDECKKYLHADTCPGEP